MRHLHVAPDFAAASAVERVLRAAVRVLGHSGRAAPRAAHVGYARGAPRAHERVEIVHDQPDVVVNELVERVVPERPGAQVLLVEADKTCKMISPG